MMKVHDCEECRAAQFEGREWCDHHTKKKPKRITDAIEEYAVLVFHAELTPAEVWDLLLELREAARKGYRHEFFGLRLIGALFHENQQLKAKIIELTTPAPHCQFQSYCTNRPTKGVYCEWHACKVEGCSNPRDKAFHSCKEH